MNKLTIKSLVIGTLVWSSIMLTHAYNLNTWAPVQYLNKIILTTDGTNNMSKASIQLDGVHGTVTAKNLNVTTKISVNGWVRAKKWLPKHSDVSNVWYAFAKDWDTWLFANGGSQYVRSDLQLRIDGKPRLVVKNKGNIWIWTDNPQNKLSIYVDWWKKNSTIWHNDDGIVLKDTRNHNYLWIRSNRNWPFISFESDSTSDHIHTRIQKRPSTDSNPNHLMINNYDWDIILRPNWKVWIWTSKHKAKLDVHGNIMMNWLPVATLADAISKSNAALSNAKTYVQLMNNVVNTDTKCSKAIVWKLNLSGQKCTSIKVMHRISHWKWFARYYTITFSKSFKWVDYLTSVSYVENATSSLIAKSQVYTDEAVASLKKSIHNVMGSSTCSGPADLGKYNIKGWHTCIADKVTNDPHCIKHDSDNQVRTIVDKSHHNPKMKCHGGKTRERRENRKGWQWSRHRVAYDDVSHAKKVWYAWSYHWN